MQLPEFLGILSGLIQIAGYASYYRLTQQGEIHPNAASWLIWFYGNLIVCISYLLIGDFSLAGILPVVCAITNVVLVIKLWRDGHFGVIEPYEKRVIVADVGITILWLSLELTTIGTRIAGYLPFSVPLFIHILLMASAIVSFIPIIRETASDRGSEHIQPWLIWSSAYLVWLIAELLSGATWQLLYPSVYLVLHGALAVLLVIKKKDSHYSTNTRL